MKQARTRAPTRAPMKGSGEAWSKASKTNANCIQIRDLEKSNAMQRSSDESNASKTNALQTVMKRGDEHKIRSWKIFVKCGRREVMEDVLLQVQRS